MRTNVCHVLARLGTTSLLRNGHVAHSRTIQARELPAAFWCVSGTKWLRNVSC